MALHTARRDTAALHFHFINDPKALYDRLPALKPDEDMIGLATHLITRQSAAFDLSDMEDRYEARLRQVIEAKMEGKGLKAEPAEKSDGKVVDLMAALGRSLGQKHDAPAAKPEKPAAKKPIRKRA